MDQLNNEGDSVAIEFDAALVRKNIRRRELEWDAAHPAPYETGAGTDADSNAGSTGTDVEKPDVEADPIVAEVRRIREAIAAKCGYDVKRISEYNAWCTQDLPVTCASPATDGRKHEC
jgi:hypothetical protein